MAYTAWDDTGQPAFRLMYRSHNRIPDDERKVKLGALFSQARSNNKRQRISGALLLSDDTFVQVLEGEEEPVRALYARIEKDPRHELVTLLDAAEHVDRVFARWSMARLSADGEADIPLIAHADGISPAAGWPSSPEQDKLLAAMHAAIGVTPRRP
jgi:hypothetical protein